jgi:sulfonate dioxygenase
MAPVATSEESGNGTIGSVTELRKAQVIKPIEETRIINPFYSPSAGNENDNDYQYAKYKVINVKFLSRSRKLMLRQAPLPRCELGTTHRN